MLSFLFVPAPSMASENPATGLLISEVQTGSATSASQEFVELHNPTDEPIDLSNQKVQYFSASTANFDPPSRSILMHGVLAPGAYYLIASNEYLTEIADDHFSAGLAQAGGHLRITDLENNVFDLVGWGTANSPEGKPAASPNAGESLQRQTDAEGYLIDTNNNAIDFKVSDVPTPQSSTGTAPTDSEPPSDEPAAEQPEEESAPAALPNLLPVQITELLPNPAPPASDSDDEYIELYNPNPEPVDLNGYKLQSGLSYSYSFIFSNQSLPANGYGVFYVSETGLLLANSGGRARLLSPNSQILSETAKYEDAVSGESWVYYGGTWQWSTTPTPAEANNLVLPPVATTKAATKTKNLKPAKKVKAAKSTNRRAKAKTKKTLGASGERDTFTPIEERTTTPLNAGILAVVGGLSVLYACYEYRNDLSNRLYQIRRYRETRRASRQTT